MYKMNLVGFFFLKINYKYDNILEYNVIIGILFGIVVFNKYVLLYY